MSVALIDDGRTHRHLLLMGNSASNTVGLYLVEQSIGNGEVVSAFSECHYLTDTESKVLLQLARGLAPKRIAQVSERSEATIRSQIRSILTKTRYGSVRELLMSLACMELSLAHARAWLSRGANVRVAMAERRSAPRITPSPAALATIGATRR